MRRITNKLKTLALKTVFLVSVLTISNIWLSNANAQETREYSGIVLDINENPVPGASIQIKGTTTGTITNPEGEFTIQAKEGEVLIISFIGYLSEEIILSSELTSKTILIEDITALEEIVVVGYGVSKKKDLTGAVTSISSKDLNEGAITNPLQQIAGKAAGVNVTQIGSEPGSNPSVRIRGITSLIGGNDPLIVVDGIQGNMDLLNTISPSEIETVDILKDASATAIYGSRGAPGVIIISTKKSKEGKIHAEYSGSVSYDVLANQLEMFNADEWREQAANWGISPAADHGSNTDWYNLLTQTGQTQNHSLSFGSATESFNFRASIATILQEGIVINSGNDKYIAKVQATQKALNNKLTFTINLNNSIENNQGSPNSVGRAAFTSNLISNAYISKPTDPVLFPDGSYFFDQEVFQYINPYAVSQTVINESETKNQFGSFKTDLEIINGLKVGWFGTWRKRTYTSGYFAPAKSTLAYAIDNNGQANVHTDLTDEKLMDIDLSFNRQFNKHKFGAVAVYEWQRQTYQGHFAQAKGFVNDITGYHALQLGSITSVQPGDISSYKNDRTLISFLGRFNYNYDERYLATFSVRRDGSSVFGKNNRWGTFPSASAAWRISEESFMQNQDVVSNLKLRVGYGVTGNQQGLYPQKSLQLIGKSGDIYFNGEYIPNFTVIQNANEDLRWETRYQTNVGLDFGLFNNELNGTIEVYSAITKNLLFDYTVPQPPYPYNTITANVGSLKNEGVELSLNYRVFNSNDWTIILGGNLSLLRNEVIELSGQVGGTEVNTDYVPWGASSYLIKGQPIGTFMVYENAGKNPETNEELVRDISGNDTIDLGDRSADRYNAGSALPTYTFAFTPTIRYKNFDLSMVWRGAGGNMIYNRIAKDLSLFENLGKSNMLKNSVDKGIYTTQYTSDLFLEKGDFFRFENLTIGYNFNFAQTSQISKMRLYLTANNLFVITKYTGLDPELNVDGGNQMGIDGGIYPRTRSIALGLNVTF